MVSHADLGDEVVRADIVEALCLRGPARAAYVAADDLNDIATPAVRASLGLLIDAYVEGNPERARPPSPALIRASPCAHGRRMRVPSAKAC
jgi:hypothetical protein